MAISQQFSGKHRPCMSRRPVGDYQHNNMLQFWWSRIFEQPIIGRLDYYCRLDTDPLLKAPSPVVIFHIMRVGHYVYGYRVGSRDSVAVTDGMWDCVDTYMRKLPSTAAHAKQNGWLLAATGDRNVTDIETYYNRFEVCLRRSN